MLIRRERPEDINAIRAVTAAAFRDAPHSAPPVENDGAPGEATLVGWLREDAGWLAALSLVAVEEESIVGHVVCSRGYVDDRPALGLGPLSVIPARQGNGVGSALMHAVLGAAEALNEELVGVLGEPGYYRRFGFDPAASHSITAPDPSWGVYFQVRTLSAHRSTGGAFRYAAPFDRL